MKTNLAMRIIQMAKNNQVISQEKMVTFVREDLPQVEKMSGYPTWMYSLAHPKNGTPVRPQSIRSSKE